MSRIDLYITFWNSGNNEDIPEWQLSVRSTSLDGGQPATTVTYSIVLVAPGTDRWIEAYQTHTEPLPSGRLMGALLLDSSEILEHVDLNTFDTFIKESEDAAPENPFPNRITDWGPELWTTARVAQLAMAEWIVLSPAAAREFDCEYHDYNRLRDRIAARKRDLRTQQQELGLRGWDNVIPFE